MDGIYSYGGIFTRWDSRGVEIRRGDGITKVKWRDLAGVRRSAPPSRYVVLLHQTVSSAQVPSQDPLAIPVHTEADANRLLNVLGWQTSGGVIAAEPPPTRGLVT